MNRELKVFLTAVMFFTRIPVPKDMEYSQDLLNESSRYYPVIGWIVGGFAGIIFYVAQVFFPASVSILLSMAASVLLTGAFHEDGFTDVCDGFGGGANKKEILDIMKDSRIGTYGTVGIIFIMLLKFTALIAIRPQLIPVVLIAGHSLSRGISSLFRRTHSYVRENDDSKVKPMAKGISKKNFFLSLAFSLTPVFLFKSIAAFLLVVPVLLAEMFFARYLGKRIGGYTGDCLGAVQQLCEVTFYLGFVLLWKFI